MEIAAALDEWCLLLVDAHTGDQFWPRLAGAARIADPAPWRNRLRDLYGRPLKESAAHLKTLSDDTDALAQQPVASLVLLARMLNQAGELERSRVVLDTAWRRSPGDFWVNFQLGAWFWVNPNASPERPGEAVRFLTAAVAVRPSSFVAHNNLGEALQDHGKAAAAVAEYRTALRLNPEMAEAHNNLGHSL